MVDLALCGAGRITMAHALAAAAVPGLRITRVASRDPAHAAERAAQLGAVACRFDDLPGGAGIVLVATPPATHAEQAVHAVDAGAVALVEKPLCKTLSQADRLVAADTANGGGRVIYGENLLHAPLVIAAQHQAREIGHISYVEARSLQPRPDWGGFTEPRWGGGVLFDLGVHPLAAALALMVPDDEPVAVRGRLDAGEGLAVDDDSEMWLRFRSGAVAHIAASWRNDTTVWDLQASSPTGVVRTELAPIPTLERDGEPQAIPPLRSGVEIQQIETFGFVAQLEDACRVSTAQVQPRCDVALGRTILEIVCAAYASAGTGGIEVAIPFTGPRDRTPLDLWHTPG